MTVELEALFANLAEQEKRKGHHSPEGQAIRTLARALNGWLTGSLSGPDVLALSHQGVEDWLKFKLKLSRWSARDFPALIAAALRNDVLTAAEAARLHEIHDASVRDEQPLNAGVVNDILECCIRIVERHW